MTLFSYLHLTDLHFCVQAQRKNAPQLRKRPWKEIIDTVPRQGKELGFSSLFLPASFDTEAAKGVAQFCSNWSDSVDGIIITGDLATTGSTADIAVAAQFVTEPAGGPEYLTADRFPTIASLQVPVHVFAGNHDRYMNNVARPFSNHFDFVFEDYMDRKTPFVGSWVSEKDEKALAFVYADFCLRTRLEASFPQQLNAYGQGRVYEDVLDELRVETLSIRREYPGIHVVWMVHFAPYECGLYLRLHEHQRYLDAAEALGVVATICGHTHELLSRELKTQTIYCGGSACCVDNVGGYMVHVLDFEVDEDCFVSRITYIWDEDNAEFVHLKDD